MTEELNKEGSKVGLNIHMSPCCSKSNRTGPGSSQNILGTGTVSMPRKHPRKNGWSWPLHLQQIIAWLAITYFVTVAFGACFPLMRSHWQPLAYIVTSLVLAIHVLMHILAVSIDPADDNVRSKIFSEPVPMFDRSVRAHVIENNYCVLCRTDVASKSKHCISCNKCVARFDHHCHWLNNCVGRRNYWFFFGTMISAVIGLSIILASIMYVFIQYFINPGALRDHPAFSELSGPNEWLVFLPSAPLRMSGISFIIFVGVTMCFDAISCILIMQLLCNHFYLFYHRITTYDYIVLKRNEKERQKRIVEERAAKAQQTNSHGIENVNRGAPIAINMDFPKQLVQGQKEASKARTDESSKHLALPPAQASAHASCHVVHENRKSTISISSKSSMDKQREIFNKGSSAAAHEGNSEVPSYFSYHHGHVASNLLEQARLTSNSAYRTGSFFRNPV
uniref:Palmitoyltransferase n=1 Tax=Petromyzon marinus TaxID=7757 RepID=A0AAJ7TBB7_PETMA|nr:probable palmitoyltransferase ZDHHC11B [Petromyzon marinus]XP_032813468.1 probable palmitoyltransferase ZDHHC11B [Petromyzon marinus]